MECVRRFLKIVDNHSAYTSDGKFMNSSDIDEYFKFVARTGKTHVPWKKLKNILISRVSKVIDEFYEDQHSGKLIECPAAEASKCLQVKEHIMQCLIECDGIPFTIQRLAELIIEPRKSYRRVDKFLRALEKNVMVITTIDPLGNRIVTDSQQNIADSWNENLFPPPSPSSRIRRMSVDELVDTSNVSSPQMVAAAMMPPPPSPPPFSPKQQKSPHPAEASNENGISSDTVEADEKPMESASPEEATDNFVDAQTAKSKKAVIIWQPDCKKSEQLSTGALCNTLTSADLCNEQQDIENNDTETLSSDETSPCRLEPLPKRQRFSDDGCADCDSTTPDNDSSSSSSASPSVPVSTVT